MDDFGSGYSYLNMLKDVPVDILKIDMHFLDGEDTSDRGNNILHSVVRMAEELQTPVITEGVENTASGRISASDRLPLCAGLLLFKASGGTCI